MRLQYEDIQILVSILRKLSDNEATALLSIVIQIYEHQTKKDAN